MRYFIIFYVGNLGKHRYHGNNSMENNCYPSREKLTQALIDLYGFTDVAITGIQEVTKQDYENWNG